MRYSYKLSDAIHILAYLEIYKEEDTSSKAIANSINSNPSVIRNIMSQLRNAGLIQTKVGTAINRLAVSSKKITIFDVYTAIDGDKVLLHVDPNTNTQCIVGHNIQTILSDSYRRIQDAAETEMKKITIADVVSGILDNSKKQDYK